MEDLIYKQKLVQINMYRYIQTREVDPNALQTPQQSFINSRITNKRQQNPEQIRNISNALRALKRSNDQENMLKRRLMFLQLQDDRNQMKALSNQRKLEIHELIRNQISQDRREKSRISLQKARKLEQSRKRVRRQKSDHNKLMNQNYTQIAYSKIEQYNQSKQHSRQISQSILQQKSKQFQSKRSKRDQIAYQELFQKEKVKVLLSNKRQEVRENQNQSSMKLSRMKEQKQKQIEELGKLERIMLQKYAHSKMTCRSTQQRLGAILPAISIKRQHEQTSRSTKSGSNRNFKKRRDLEMVIL